MTRRRLPRPRSGDASVDEAITALVEAGDFGDDADLVVEMLGNVARYGLEGNDRGHLKLLNVALRDIRRAGAQFLPYTGRRKCSVFGSARTLPDAPAYRAAHDLGAALAANDWMVITGGGPGIMTAAIEGAGRDNSFGVTIRLPFEPMDAGGIVPDERLVRFRHFFTRKLTFMRESSAYVVFPGGFGTLDETFELLTLIQTGKEPPAPVVLFAPDEDVYWDVWREFVHEELLIAELVSPVDLDLVHITGSVDDAVAYIDGFYRQFHSMRYVEGRLVIRLVSEMDDAALAALNEEFADIVVDGHIERTEPMAAEVDDGDELDRPRLVFTFDNRHFGRLHQLVRSL